MIGVGVGILDCAYRAAQATPAPSGPVNIVDPSGWGNPSSGAVSADGTGNITFTSSGSGVNISEVPLVALKPSTLYDLSGNWSGTAFKVIFYVGASGTLFTFPSGPGSGSFTTPADVGDGKLRVQRSGVGSISGTLSALIVTEH